MTERRSRVLKVGGQTAVMTLAAGLGAFLNSCAAPTAQAGLESRVVVPETKEVAESRRQDAMDHRLERMEDTLNHIWERIRK